MESVNTQDVQVSFRETVRESDEKAVYDIVMSIGFFSEEEVSIALELIRERLAKGEASGYSFLFAESMGEVIGYTCYGRIPATTHSYDLYWIVVKAGHRRRGIGRLLIRKTEELIARQGGVRIYIETSSRSQYESTREFYRRCGYEVEAVLKDLYSPGDDKLVYLKPIEG